MLNAVFHISVANVRDLPRDSLAEVAFAGRSNAGKSSAINTLCNQKRLAYVSKLPGRTQLLNFFQVEPGRFLVDLPGYGFAKAPKAQQDTWQSLIGGYLARSAHLKGLVLIMDIRHPLTELDWSLLEWFRPSGKPVHVLLSKSDKISRGAGQQTRLAVMKALREAGMEASVQLFSSLKRDGLDEAESLLRGWLDTAKKSAEGKNTRPQKLQPGEDDPGVAPESPLREGSGSGGPSSAIL